MIIALIFQGAAATVKRLKSLKSLLMRLLLKASNNLALLRPANERFTRQSDVESRLRQQVFEPHPQFLEQTTVAAFQTLSSEFIVPEKMT